MADAQVRVAEGAADVEVARALMREYGDYLAHLAEEPGRAASICISGYESELAGLPEPYVAPGVLLLAWVEGEAAGCIALKALRLKGAVAGEGGMALELKRLWVRRRFRGLALGRRLMQAAIDFGRRVRARCIWIQCRRRCLKPTGCMRRWGSSGWSDTTTTMWPILLSSGWGCEGQLSRGGD